MTYKVIFSKLYMTKYNYGHTYRTCIFNTHPFHMNIYHITLIFFIICIFTLFYTQVRERKCQRPVAPPELDPIEKLLESIRSEPALRKTPSGNRLVETSRTKLDSEDEPTPMKKVITAPGEIKFSLGDFSVSLI